MLVYTENSTPVVLDDNPLAQGGEGAIHAMVGHPDKVAKLYRDKGEAQQRRAKIEAMVSIRSRFDRDDEAGTIAWPLGALYADPQRLVFVGFGMRKASTPLTIDALYEYPPAPNANFDMADKLRVMEALAQLTQNAHDAGQVVGDYNDNNVAVLPGCRVALLDADSFHACVNGTVYPCTVCMPGYAAPEVLRNMHGFATYEECTKPTFTVHTDDWALAVHVFRTLFNGVHPYHCVAAPTGGGSLPAVLPIDKRVERGEVPLLEKSRGVKAPPFAPTSRMLPPYLRTLFKRAFVTGHRDPAARPRAEEWRAALERFRGELVQCGENGAHRYWKALGSCPYCQADKRARTALSQLTSTPPASSTSGIPAPTAPTPAALAAATAAGGANAAAAAPAHAPVARPSIGSVIEGIVKCVLYVLTALLIVGVVLVGIAGAAIGMG